MNRGVLYMLVASLFFALMGAFAKALSTTLDPLQIVFFRNLVGVLVVAATLWRRPLRQRGGRPWLLVFRGLIGFLALLAFFYNIAHITLADAMTFSRSSPIFTALLAYWLLGERIGRGGWLAVAAGFAGIVLIMRPAGLRFDYTDLLGLFSGLGAALAYTSVRELKRYYDTRAIVLSFMIVGTLGPLLLMWLSPWLPAFAALDFARGTFVMPGGSLWLLILGLGLTATSAQIFMTMAYGATRAGIADTASYANILFSLVLGVLLGDAFPDAVGLFGIALVIAAGVMVARQRA